MCSSEIWEEARKIKPDRLQNVAEVHTQYANV
jgi:hypothetical protein